MADNSGKVQGASSSKGKRRVSRFELSQAQVMDMKLAFDNFDVNHTGFIGENDLRVTLRALGFEPKWQELRQMMAEIDASKTGKVSFSDFLNLMTKKIGEQDTPEDLVKAFRLMDEERSGAISFENLKKVANLLSEEKNDEEIQEMIAFADMNKNGVVSEVEFLRFLKETRLTD